MTFHTRSRFSSFSTDSPNDENRLHVRKVIFVPTSYSMKTDGYESLLGTTLAETQI